MAVGAEEFSFGIFLFIFFHFLACFSLFFSFFFEQNILQDTLCETRTKSAKCYRDLHVRNIKYRSTRVVVLSGRAVARQVHLPGIIHQVSTKIEGFRLDSHVGRRRRTDRAQPQPDVPPSRKCILCQPGVNGFLKSLKVKMVRLVTCQTQSSHLLPSLRRLASRSR